MNDEQSNLLQEAINEGIIDLAYMEDIIKMKRRERILINHPYQIWFGAEDKWHTYLPDEKKGRVHRKRATRQEIEDLIVDYYQNNKDFIVEKYTFKDCYESWRSMKIECEISPNTIYKYDHDYKRYFSCTDFERSDIKNINEETITIFMIQTIKRLNLKEKSAKSLWGYISGVFRSAKANRIIEENPCEYVEIKRFNKFYNRDYNTATRVFTEEEWNKLLIRLKEDHIKKPTYMPSYAIELALYTGMRVGELAGLKWSNIFFKEGYILISESEKRNRLTGEYYMDTTKTMKERRFPITDVIREFLTNLKKVEFANGILGDFVFCGVHAKRISEAVKTKCVQCNIPEKPIHAIRRTVNSRLRCNGVSASVAASLLGHTVDVNENHYSYDITNMDYKKKVLDNIQAL